MDGATSIETLMNPRESSVAAVSTGKESPQARKLRQAAQEFEAILVSSWWEEMQKSFQDETDQELGSGFESLQGMGFNAIATSMAASGGVGIARMLFHSLEPALSRDNAG